MGDVNVSKNYEEKTTSGTTANAYASALTVDTRRMDNINFNIKNTGASNGLTYQVLAYSMYDGTISATATSAANVAQSASAEVIYTAKYYAKIVIQVKSQTTDQATTYLIELIQKG